jgi:hypothetical protein
MMLLALQQESQEDVTKDFKASIKYLPARVPQAVAEKIQHDQSYRDQVENRDGDDFESEGGFREEAFRTQRVWLDEDDERSDFWTLKRANPIFDKDEKEVDEDEDESCSESPSKRSRYQTLTWSDRFSGWGDSQLEGRD